MQLYAHKSFLCSVHVAKEDELISGIGNEFFVKKGELLLTDQNGNTFPITEKRFEEYYLPVNKGETSNQSTQLSPLEDEFINAYANWTGEELSQEEDQEYILAMQQMATNKAF